MHTYIFVRYNKPIFHTVWMECRHAEDFPVARNCGKVVSAAWFSSSRGFLSVQPKSACFREKL